MPLPIRQVCLPVTQFLLCSLKKRVLVCTSVDTHCLKIKRCVIISVMGLEDKRGMLTFSLQSTPVTGQHEILSGQIVGRQGRTLSFQQVA